VSMHGQGEAQEPESPDDPREPTPREAGTTPDDPPSAPEAPDMPSDPDRDPSQSPPDVGSSLVQRRREDGAAESAVPRCQLGVSEENGVGECAADVDADHRHVRRLGWPWHFPHKFSAEFASY
jgi:hypothetical protein